MIAIAIVGIVSALAVPAYRTYVETTNMTKTNAAYEHAVRTARAAFAKQQSRASLGLPSNVPTTSEGWIRLFDEDNQVMAPGGGPAYITRDSQGSDKGKGKSKGKGKGKGKGQDSVPDPENTGAIVIDVNKSGTRVDVYRPAYLDLKPFRARIGQDLLEFEEL